MLVAAAGNTAMQSLLPAIGRVLGVADIMVAIAFSLSAMLWVVMAPVWAERADRRGRRALMRLGLYGFIASMLICGGALAAGLAGLIGADRSCSRSSSSGAASTARFGSASPPAVQAYIAARTEGEQRTNALALLASSFGLGTIIGPAIAPLFIFPPLGLAAPAVVFAGIGASVLGADRPAPAGRYAARAGARPDRLLSRRSAACDAGAASEATRGNGPLRWTDPRILPWHIMGIVGGHGQAVLLAVIGFLVIDRLARAARSCPAMDRDRADGGRRSPPCSRNGG